MLTDLQQELQRRARIVDRPLLSGRFSPFEVGQFTGQRVRERAFGVEILVVRVLAAGIFAAEVVMAANPVPLQAIPLLLQNSRQRVSCFATASASASVAVTIFTASSSGF